MIRKLTLLTSALIFAVAAGFGLGVPVASAAHHVDCTKVMSELNSGKKPKAVAADLKISTSSVYRCRKRASASTTSSTKKMTSSKTTSSSTSSSTSTAPSSSSAGSK